MLYHTQDLPVPVHHTPDIFTQFRKDNEHITPVRPPLPTQLPCRACPLGWNPGELPDPADLGHSL